jgi:hypothetical protein
VVVEDMTDVNGEGVVSVERPAVEELPVTVVLVYDEENRRFASEHGATEVGVSHHWGSSLYDA